MYKPFLLALLLVADIVFQSWEGFLKTQLMLSCMASRGAFFTHTFTQKGSGIQ